MDSNSQYPYEDMPEGREPEPIPPTPGAQRARESGLDAHRRRILKQAGMTDAEVDRVMAGKDTVDQAARRAVIAANERFLAGTTRASVDMIEWVDAFVAALNADAIRPEDF